jgi:hypothetical protein
LTATFKEEEMDITRELNMHLNLYLELGEYETEEEARARFDRIIKILEDNTKGLSTQIYDVEYQEI